MSSCWLKAIWLVCSDTGHIRHTTFSLFYINFFFPRWPVRLRMNVMQKKPTKFNPMQYYNYWYFQRLFITLFSFQKKTEWKRDVSSVLCQFQQSKRQFLVVIMLIMLEVGSYMRCTFLVCAEESKVIKKLWFLNYQRAGVSFSTFFGTVLQSFVYFWIMD